MGMEVNTISKYMYVYGQQRNKLEYILNYEHKIVEYTADMRHDEFKVTQFVVNDKSVQIYIVHVILRSSNRYDD
jgi:hypothetical protein